jgi:hypothetical protein
VTNSVLLMLEETLVYIRLSESLACRWKGYMHIAELQPADCRENPRLVRVFCVEVRCVVCRPLAVLPLQWI